MRSCSRMIVALAGVLISSAALAQSNLPTADSQPIEPIFTRQQLFRIPFSIDTPEAEHQQPREVQLYVSDNLGQQWWPAGSVSPAEEKFTFQAPRDGEYWFVIRTIDQFGRRLPEVDQIPIRPELKVIVDTEQPVLQLSAGLGRPGELKLRWRATDRFLAADRPQIEYLELDSPQSHWRLVAINAQLEGETSLPMPAGPVAIRARIGDLAGNVVVTQARVDPQHDDREATGTPTGNGQPAVGRATVASTEPALTNDNHLSQGGQASLINTVALASKVRGSDASPVADQQEVTVQKPAQGEIINPDSIAESNEPEQDFASLLNPKPMVPAGVTPSLVNSRRFTLEYDVASVGPSGIGKVQLWGTSDGGRRWELFEQDDDKRTPVEVRVKDDGTFGFRIAIESGSGIGGDAPKPGDAPEIWVTVDTKKPAARLTSITNSEGEMGALEIEWEAEDSHLDARPISLFFSGQASGPWYPIAEGLENTGRYTWQATDRLPGQIHIRMEVRDGAGNVSLVDGGGAVTADRMRPQGRIKQAKPLNSRRDTPYFLR